MKKSVANGASTLNADEYVVTCCCWSKKKNTNNKIGHCNARAFHIFNHKRSTQSHRPKLYPNASLSLSDRWKMNAEYFHDNVDMMILEAVNLCGCKAHVYACDWSGKKNKRMTSLFPTSGRNNKSQSLGKLHVIDFRFFLHVTHTDRGNGRVLRLPA